MLPKKNRAGTKAVEKIFKQGKFLNSPSLTFKFILTPDSGTPRISFIVSKTVSKKAVSRNFLRRRGYNVLKKYINKFPVGILGVFIFKKSINSILEIEDEVKTILKKI